MAVLVVIFILLGVLMRAVNTSEGFLELSHTDNLAAAYVPILILLILGYVLQGIDGSIQTLQPYKMLHQGGPAGCRGMRFTPNYSSPFSISYRALRDARSFALFFSSLTVLLYPGVKLAAAGLYTTDFLGKPVNVSIGIDNSLMRNLDGNFSKAVLGTVTNFGSSGPEDGTSHPTADTFLLRGAFQMTTWLENVDSAFRPPSGSVDSLTFSSLTSTSGEDLLDTFGLHSSLSASIPATRANVNCTSYGVDDLIVRLETDGDRILTNQLNVVASRGPFKSSVNNSTSPWEGIQKYNAFYSIDPTTARIVGGVVSFDNPGDLTSKNNGRNVTLTPSHLAVFVCDREFLKVNVGVTWSREQQFELGKETILPPTITNYSSDSIEEVKDMEPFNSSVLTWIAPGTVFENWGTASNGNLATSFNGFLGLVLRHTVRVYGEDALDPENLADSARRMYTLYSAQAINNVRQSLANDDEPITNTTATLTRQVARLHQSEPVTIALIALLGFILFCVVITFCGVRTRAIVPLAPNSIAVQLSMLVGSDLVEILRREGEQSPQQRLGRELWAWMVGD